MATAFRLECGCTHEEPCYDHLVAPWDEDTEREHQQQLEALEQLVQRAEVRAAQLHQQGLYALYASQEKLVQPAQQSYRLGDRANKNLPDGDYFMRGTGIEATTTKDGNPQLKFGSIVLGGPMNGRTHTWWASLTEQSLWRLFNDLIALGFNPDFDMGPPDAPRWAQVISQGFVNNGFQANVNTKNDFTNTNIKGPVQLGPDGMPVGMAALAVAPPVAGAFPGAAGASSGPVPFGAPAFGAPPQNQPQAVHWAPTPPPMAFGNQPPVPAQVAAQPPQPPQIQPTSAWPNAQVTPAGALTVVEQRVIDGVTWEKLSDGSVRQAPTPPPNATGYSDVTALFRQQ